MLLPSPDILRIFSVHRPAPAPPRMLVADANCSDSHPSFSSSPSRSHAYFSSGVSCLCLFFCVCVRVWAVVAYYVYAHDKTHKISLGVITWEVLCGGSKLPYDGVPDDKVSLLFFCIFCCGPRIVHLDACGHRPWLLRVGLEKRMASFVVSLVFQCGIR